MDESWNLLLILAAVYLLECFMWVRRGGIAFTSWLGKKWQIRFPGLFFSNWRGGLVFLQPCPPLGQAFSCEQFLFSLTSEAAYSYSAACIDPAWRAAQPARLIFFKDIEKIERREKEIWINDTLFLKAGSESHASQTAAFLRQLQKLPSEKRAAEIERFVAESLDQKQILARMEGFRSTTRKIHLLANILFIYLFALIPLVLWLVGLRQSWIPLVAVLLGQTFSIAILFRRAHKRLYQNPNDDWFVPFITIMLAPSAAIRARDALARHLLLGFHPIAVAQLLCRDQPPEAFASRAVRDMRFPRLPVCPTQDGKAVAVEESFRLLLLRKITASLEATKIDVSAFYNPPAASEPVHRSYCPRCQTQYVTLEGSCGECGGRPLQPL